MKGYSKVSLSSLCSGAAGELFDREMDTVMANIRDVNTDPTATREITLKITIKPDASRDFGKAVLGVSSKLAKVKDQSVPLFFGADGKAYEANQNEVAEVPHLRKAT